MRDHTPEGDRNARRRPRALVVAFALAVVAAPLAATAAIHAGHSAPPLVRAEGHSRATPGGAARLEKPQAGVAKRAHFSKPTQLGKPKVLYLKKARSVVFDVRRLKSVVVKKERPEDGGPAADADAAAADTDAVAATTDPDNAEAAPATPGSSAQSPAAPAPGPDSSFAGLDFANWGAGHPPDENGDVGSTYYIQTINSSIGIFDKSTGTRVAAFTFDAFMSQGQFGNLCDTDNFGDPVVLYDSYENRWFVTDFAFKLDGSGNVNPQTVYQCFAVSKTGDPVNGGWNFYSILDPGGLGDYPKFGVWPDGIYMSANMFGYSATSSYIAPHVWALDKQQMYAGAPTVQVVDFAGPSDDFTLLPANSRLQDGSPPASSPEYFVSTEQFLNALSIYKLHVDWDKVSTSTFTGPNTQLAPNCWPNATPANASTTANAADVLAIRAMAQAQYTNQGGAESVWVDHTVERGVSATNTTCNAPTGGNATVRWYQANVTGGTVAANVVQGATYDPEAANTFFRYVPSLAVDRVGDMTMDYTKSNSTTNPQIKYAGRLAGDPVNTLGQGEQTLIDGTGSQSGTCGGATCTRWGDYSGMALDPNGCEFWTTGEYYATTGLNHQTRIGSFHYPSCTTVGNGTLSGTVTDGTNPIAGAVVTLGSRTTPTDGSGHYSFSVPAGTYPSETADKPGFNTGIASTLVVPDGGTRTQNFALTAAPQSGCFVDNTQTAFQRGIPANCDLTSSPGNVVLASPDNTAAKNSNVNPTGFGFNNTSWAGQTFTPTVTGKLKRVDVELFCSGCSGTNPDITVSIRNTTTGTNPVPTGGDLVTATLPGFNDGAAGGLKTVTFASPITLTAGTRYAFIFRSTAARTGTYAYTCSCSAPGFSNSNPYSGGQFVTSSTSGSSWSADTTTGGRDLNFVTYISGGFTPTGTFVSSLKDANPQAGGAAHWTTLSWTATTPVGTGVKFQVAGSNSPDGPFTFVGPDGTAGTFFTTSGASLSQFDGLRYLKYKAVLSTSSGSVTPSISSVSVCFTDTSSATSPTTLAVDPAGGTFGGTTSLSATLTSNGNPVANESVSFILNGSSAGSAKTNSSGVATISGAGLSGIGAGTYPAGVGASFAGDAGFDPSTGSAALTVSKAAQSITVTTHAPSSAVYGTGFSVAATGGGSGNPVTFSSSGGCSNTGAAFTMTSGTTACQVKYDQAGNSNYNAAPTVTESVTASKAAQAITVTTHAPGSAVYNTSFSVAATGGGSGNAVTFSSAGSCSNTGASFTMTSGTGTCSVKYDQAGDANYSAAPTVTESMTANKAAQSISVTTHAPSSAVFGSLFAVAATASSGNGVTFSSSGGCSNSGATFTMTSGTTSCSVKYDQAGDANYSAAPTVTETVTASKAAQAITVTTHAPGSAVYNTGFSVAATGGGSGNAVTFASSGGCSNSGAAFTMTSGTTACTVKYDQAGNANYTAAPTVTETVNALKAAQSISVTTPAPSTAVYGTSFSVAATAPAGLVSFSSGGVCVNIGGTFTMGSGTGTCTVKYDQAGDNNYNAAPEVTETVTASKAAQAITVTTHAPPNAANGSQFTVAATGGGSSSPVVYSSSGGCSNSGATFTMTSGTTACSVMYDQAGDDNYDAAPEVIETVNAGQDTQAIIVTTHAPPSAVYGSQFTVAATGGGSGNPVTFSSSGGCSNSGATFTMTSGTTACTVNYDQAGNANYTAAPTLTETVTAVKAAQSVTVTTHAPGSAVYQTGFSVAATGGASGNAITFSSAGACSNSGASFTMTSGTGSCSVKYDQAGNANYSAAPTVTETVTAVKAAQSIMVTTHAPAKATSGSQFTVAATAPGGAISYSSAGACTNSGSTFTMTSAKGNCTVKYDQAGNSNYKAAPEVSEKVKAVAAFGGFRVPAPRSSRNRAGAKIAVKFTLRDATGRRLTSAEAAALAAAGGVKVVLSGPNARSRNLAAARCRWVGKSRVFSCGLKTPSGLKAGKANRYSLTALQNVDGSFTPIPPFATKAAAANPATIFFQKRRRHH